ncbi:MAG TPA: hypothetical protein VFL80_09205, partial [Thermoanaerobaculia bacterium]|nr:hypothetical protein [Thermoanaerobaculia bacterium]
MHVTHIGAHDGPVIALAAAAIVQSLAAIALYLIGRRPLSFDEIEFARATQWIAEGRVPYRDFWEHHLPLQWYLFAPLKAVEKSVGAAGIVSLRLAQVPLWIVTLFGLNRWMAAAGMALRSRLLAVAVLLSSLTFSLIALEYRVDALATLLVVFALLFSRRTGSYPMAAAALLSMALLANLRALPAVAAIFAATILPHGPPFIRNGMRRAGLALAGALLPWAAYVAYLGVTVSAESFWQRVVIDNRVMERLMSAHAKPTLRHVFALFVQEMDFGSMLLLTATAAGTLLALSRFRTFGPWQLLAVVQVVSALFIVTMPVHYPYHFLSVLLLSAPFVAYLAEEWFSVRAAVALGAFLCFTSILNLASAFQATTERFRYQDFVMRT